jgi:hypothetical protein
VSDNRGARARRGGGGLSQRAAVAGERFSSLKSHGHGMSCPSSPRHSVDHVCKSASALSQTTAKMRLSGIRGELLVFCIVRIYNMDCSFTPSKAKDPLSACNAAGPSNTPRRISPMVRLRYTTYLTTSYAIRIPPILRIAGDISTSGGVL